MWGELGNGRYMGAYAIAAQLRKKGLSVTVIDYFTRHPDFFKYLEDFLDKDTLAIGISSTFLAPLENERQYTQRSESIRGFNSGELWFENFGQLDTWMTKLKELLSAKCENARVVLGGVKSQNAIKRPELYKIFDYVAVGPADATFAEFVLALKSNSPVNYIDRNGIKLINTTYDVNNKFCPTIDWLKDDGIQFRESLPLEIARGCIFNCKFCHYLKQESFGKNIDDLKMELIRNYENFRIDTYAFCDDCFNDHPKKVIATCEMILSLPFKIEWISYARVDVAIKYPETLSLMVESGARGLFWGIESLNYEVLKKVGKGTHPDLVKELLISLAVKYKSTCISEISLITGLPGETNDSLNATKNWFLEGPEQDILSVGSLMLASYNQELDKKIFDYAEYSRNPQKFGFKKIEFGPDYWEHDSMNSKQAEEWATELRSSYLNRKSTYQAKSVWLYPHLKTLGYSSEESFQFFRRDKNQDYDLTEAKNRFQQFLGKYWNSLSDNRT